MNASTRAPQVPALDAVAPGVDPFVAPDSVQSAVAAVAPNDTPFPAPEAEGAGAISRRYVRVLSRGPGPLVRFEFAVGWPDLAVELAMPEPLFEEFCITQQATRLPEGPPAADPPHEPLAPGRGEDQA